MNQAQLKKLAQDAFRVKKSPDGKITEVHCAGGKIYKADAAPSRGTKPQEDK